MRKPKQRNAATIWDGKNPHNANPVCQSCAKTCKYSRTVQILSCPRYQKTDSGNNNK